MTTAITDIFTVGSEIHEGWNYYKLNEHMSASAYPPKYRYYRLFNAENNGCDYIGEINFIGQKVINEDTQTTQCDVVVSGDDIESIIVPDKVEYSVPATPFVESISPRWGSGKGNTEVTFTGQNFNPEAALYTIIIDEAECTVTAATTTSVTCITGPKTCSCTNPNPEISIHMAQPSSGSGSSTGSGTEPYGYAALQGNDFRYGSLWSEDSTWGGLFAPVEGESVSVPAGRTLIFDIDHSPILNLVILDGGSIIFPSDTDPNHERTFDAHYIFLNNNATMEIGTEADPYSSKMTLTLHGSKYEPYIPKYGNKCIGVRFSTLDIHGMPRTPTWTTLETTGVIGATTITLSEDVDWQIGEEIVIASTDLGIEDNEIPGEGDNSE